MKDCLFLVLLLAIVSNAFEETSYFSTTSKAEINTTESTEDHKSKINATESIKDYGQSFLRINYTFSNKLRNNLNKLRNNPLLKSDDIITKVFLDAADIFLRNVEFRIKELITDKLKINTIESTENYKPEINITEPTEDHKFEINTTKPTNDYKPEINTIEPTENHKFPLILSDSLEKLNKLMYPSASANNFLKELITLQKLHTQSIESNVDNEITESTLKDNSKLKIIPKVVQIKYENKNETTTVPSYILRGFGILPLTQKTEGEKEQERA